MSEPLPGYGADPGASRRHALRLAIVNGVLLAAALVLLLAMISRRVDEESGGSGYFPVVIVALVATFVGYQGLQAIRDLRAEPTVTAGKVRRKWRRATFLVAQHSYIQVGKRVFKIDPAAYDAIDPDDDVVITHLPHTLGVETLTMSRPPRGGEA